MRLTEIISVNGKEYVNIKGTKGIYVNAERKGAPASNAIVRLAAYEDAEEQGLLVPVVRCKDCKFYVPGDNLANEAYMCTLDADWDEEDNCYYGFTSYPSKDYFCAGGQRKEKQNEK
jgi:hypothetical protein